MVRKVGGTIMFVFVFLASVQLFIGEIESRLSEPEAVPAGTLKSEAHLSDFGIPALEWYLVSREENNGYIVETYREFEVYRAMDGEISKKNPTDHYEYIRYKN